MFIGFSLSNMSCYAESFDSGSVLRIPMWTLKKKRQNISQQKTVTKSRKNKRNHLADATSQNAISTETKRNTNHRNDHIERIGVMTRMTVMMRTMKSHDAMVDGIVVNRAVMTKSGVLVVFQRKIRKWIMLTFGIAPLRL